MARATGSSSPSRHLTRRFVLALLIAILLLSLGLRVYRLGNRSVWWDEGWSTWTARQSLSSIAQRAAEDVHPPLYFWMLHAWRLASGDSEFGLRLLSVGMGVLAVAATYRLGRIIGGSITGLLAALLITLSRFHIAWSQEMRMYALVALLAALTFWAAIRAWSRQRPIDLALYVVFMTAGLYTLYLSLSVFVAVNLAWLLTLRPSTDRRGALIRWGVGQIAVLVLFTPWLLYAASHIRTGSTASPVALDAFLRIYWTVLTVGAITSVEDYLPLTVPVMLVFLAGLIAVWRKTRGDWQMRASLVLGCLGLLLPAAVVYVISLPRQAFFYAPQLAPRYLLLSLPAYCVLMAWGLATLAAGAHLLSFRNQTRSDSGQARSRIRQIVSALPIVLVAGVSGYGVPGHYPGLISADDYRSLASTLRAYRQASDAVVLQPDTDWPIFAYHYADAWNGVPNRWLITPELADTYLSPIWDRHDGVWLVVTHYAALNDPQGNLAAWLNERAHTAMEYRFCDKLLRFYARTTLRAESIDKLVPGALPLHGLTIEAGAGLRLVGYDQAVPEYYAGDTIHLFLYWERNDSSAWQEVNVGLIDEGGRMMKSIHVPVPESRATGLFRQQVDLTIPPDVLDGTYAFAVQVAPSSTAMRFGRVTLHSNLQAALTVADVSIEHPLETNFGDGVRLLGYDVGAENVRPGEVVPLTLYWQARQPPEHRYKIFTHLLGEVFNAGTGNFLWGQQDNEPVNGTRPMPTWRAGEVIVDRYAITLSNQAPPGRYSLEVGLYDPVTGERAPVLDGQEQPIGDHVVLTAFRVEGSTSGIP